MTKEELLQKLSEIEWDDFECKAAQDKLPEDVWATVSAFSNTSGGWIIFGIKQRGKQFEIQGLNKRTQIHSIPRNPKLIKFFRYAKLGENAGYGIDKMLAWERLTKGKVDFVSDLVSSTITYWFGEQASEQVSGQAGGTVSGTVGEQPREQVGEQPREQVQRLVNVMREDACTLSDILKRLRLKGRRYVYMFFIKPAIEGGYVLRSYPDKPNHPKQRYYLSEKGLKLVK